jgi:hypothetical protein
VFSVYTRRKSVQIFSFSALTISVIAIIIELLPEMEAKPFVIAALILTIILSLIEIWKSQEKMR